MFYNNETHTKQKRFINLAELDQFIHHTYRDTSGIEHRCLELGAVRRMTAYFDRLERQLKQVSTSKTPPSYQHNRGISMTPEGRQLWQVLRDAETEAPLDICEGRRLNPWLNIGLRLARKWTQTLRRYTSGGPNDLNLNEDHPRKIMMRLFKLIRRVCHSKAFRNWVNNDTRNAKENYLSCANMMIDLFEKHARLLILRIDLYFEGDAKIFSESKAADKAYGKFLRSLRAHRIFLNAKYIAKRENGLERRIHYHVMVILDGDKHQHAYALAEQLGEFWVHCCVGSEALASYFNSWVRRHEVNYSCMGLLHYTDSRMLMGLREAIEYLCKEGAHILVTKGLGRNLRKSLSPKRMEGQVRRGAPRKHDRDLSAARQVLLTLDLQSSVKQPPPSTRGQTKNRFCFRPAESEP